MFKGAWYGSVNNYKILYILKSATEEITILVDNVVCCPSPKAKFTIYATLSIASETIKCKI